MDGGGLRRRMVGGSYQEQSGRQLARKAYLRISLRSSTGSVRRVGEVGEAGTMVIAKNLRSFTS